LATHPHFEPNHVYGPAALFAAFQHQLIWL
jgi:hypothetical protein